MYHIYIYVFFRKLYDKKEDDDDKIEDEDKEGSRLDAKIFSFKTFYFLVCTDLLLSINSYFL